MRNAFEKTVQKINEIEKSGNNYSEYMLELHKQTMDRIKKRLTKSSKL